MILGHGGNTYQLAKSLGCRSSEILDVSSNINPLGPPPGLMAHLRDHLQVVEALPEVDSAAITAGMAEAMGVDPTRLLAGGGTTQFIYSLIPALGCRRVLILAPTYSDYADACRMHGLTPAFFELKPEQDFEVEPDRLDAAVGAVDTVVICNPNNPTGRLINAEQLLWLCRRHGQTRFVIDESYLPFVDGAGQHSLTGAGLDNVIVLHSLSKIFRLPGLRIGFLFASAITVACFKAYATPWCVNSLAQAAVEYLVHYRPEMTAFVERSRRFVASARERFLDKVAPCAKIRTFPSCTPYVLMKLTHPLSAGTVSEQLARRRILIRNCSNFHGLSDRYIRISMQRRAVNDKVATALLAAVGMVS